MSADHAFPRLSGSAAEAATQLRAAERRVLLIGAPGTGKSTLTAAMAAWLAAAGAPVSCITADPGSPAFGVPGAVALARWRDGGWQAEQLEALCSLDAGRFRLPLAAAVRRLARRFPAGPLLIDAPGLVRGVAGAELLVGLAQAAAVEAVLVLVRAGQPVPLVDELQALSAPVFVMQAAAEARDAGRSERARRRTVLWDAHLGQGLEQWLTLAELRLLGTPPPTDLPAVWAGRQIALLGRGRTLSLGEVVRLEQGRVLLRLAGSAPSAEMLLVRNAVRSEEGLLVTAQPPAQAPAPEIVPQGEGLPPGLRVGNAVAVLVNGVLGDPLLLLRPRNSRRGLLFDLGDIGRLPLPVAHQVTDVFITHGHIDHIGGFLGLLRARIGDFPPCRLYGPPGLAGHVEAFVRGVLWDRIGDNGPVFEVTELHGERLRRHRIQAGRGCELIEEKAAPAGVVADEPAFRVRAVALDHGFGTTSLAYALEPPMELNVRKERLSARGLAPGPWLGELKRRVLAGEMQSVLELPNGDRRPVAALADELLLITPGAKLAYATDFGDTPANRSRLAALAEGAYTFFCEASFMQADAAQAERTGHLTTRACAEIAAAAKVQRLVPFHYSRRYEEDPERAYAEVKAVFPRAVRI
jgi:ribonuclease Z